MDLLRCIAKGGRIVKNGEFEWQLRKLGRKTLQNIKILAFQLTSKTACSLNLGGKRPLPPKYFHSLLIQRRIISFNISSCVPVGYGIIVNGKVN